MYMSTLKINFIQKQYYKYETTDDQLRNNIWFLYSIIFLKHEVSRNTWIKCSQIQIKMGKHISKQFIEK